MSHCFTATLHLMVKNPVALSQCSWSRRCTLLLTHTHLHTHIRTHTFTSAQRALSFTPQGANSLERAAVSLLESPVPLSVCWLLFFCLLLLSPFLPPSSPLAMFLSCLYLPLSAASQVALIQFTDALLALIKSCLPKKHI